MSHQVYGDYMMNMPTNWRSLARLGVKDVAERTKFTTFMKREEIDVLGVESSRTERIQQEMMQKHPNEGKQMISLMVYAEERRLDALEKEKHDKLKAQLIERREKQQARKLEAIKLPKFVDSQGNAVPIGCASSRAWMLEHNPDAYYRWATLLKDATKAQQSKNYTATREKQEMQRGTISRKLDEKQAQQEAAAIEFERDRAAQLAAIEAKQRARIKEVTERAEKELVRTHNAHLEEVEQTRRKQQLLAEQRENELRDLTLQRQTKSLSTQMAVEDRLAFSERIREWKGEKARAEWERKVALSLQQRQRDLEASSTNAAQTARSHDSSVAQRREQLERELAEKTETTVAKLSKKQEQIERHFDDLNKDHMNFVNQVEKRLATHEDRQLALLGQLAETKKQLNAELVHDLAIHRQRRLEKLQETSETAHALTARKPATTQAVTLYDKGQRSQSRERKLIASPPSAAVPLDRFERQPRAPMPQTSPHETEASRSPSNERAGDSDAPLSERRSPRSGSASARVEAIDRMLFTYDRLDERSRAILDARATKDAAALARREAENDCSATQQTRKAKWIESRVRGMKIAQSKQNQFEEKNARLMVKPKPRHFSPPKSLLLWAPKLRDPYEERPALPSLPSAALAPTRDPFLKAPPLPSAAPQPVPPPESTGLRTPNSKRQNDLGLSGTIASTSTARMGADAQLREAQQRAEAHEAAQAERIRREAERAESKKRAAEERRKAAADKKEAEYKLALQERLQRHDAENAKNAAARLLQAEEALKRNHAMLEASNLRKDDFINERATRIATDHTRRDANAKFHREALERLHEEKVHATIRRAATEKDRFTMVFDDDAHDSPFSGATPVKSENLDTANVSQIES